MKNSSGSKAIVILGLSASGKTELALRIGKDLNKSVLSADSRQVYRGLNYSTGKIKKSDKVSYEKENNKWVIDGINYWGYDLVEPNEEFSAGDFVEFTKNVLEKEEKTPIICGGTGLYIAAITDKTSLTKVPRDPKLRKELSDKPLKKVQDKLEDLGFDLFKLNNSELHNKQRLIRRVEKRTQMETNKTNSKELRFDMLEHVQEKEYLFIGLKLKKYKPKIKNWIEQNFKEIEKEVKWLLKNYPDSPLFSGFIFQEMKDYIEGNIDRKETKSLISTRYLQYIKRQMTYFKKHFPNTHWFSNKEKAFSFLNNHI